MSSHDFLWPHASWKTTTSLQTNSLESDPETRPERSTRNPGCWWNPTCREGTRACRPPGGEEHSCPILGPISWQPVYFRQELTSLRWRKGKCDMILWSYMDIHPFFYLNLLFSSVKCKTKSTEHYSTAQKMWGKEQKTTIKQSEHIKHKQTEDLGR